MVFTWNCKMAGVRKSSPSATGVEMGCVVKVDPMQKKKITHTLAVYYHNKDNRNGKGAKQMTRHQ
jgi:hypothetical protein